MGDTSASSSSGDTSCDSYSSSGSSSSTSTEGVSEQVDIEELFLQMSKDSMLALRAKMLGASKGTEKATKSSLVVASKHGAVTTLPVTPVSEVTKEKSRKRGRGDPSNKVLADAARPYSKALLPDKGKLNFLSRDLIPQGREDLSAIGTDDGANKVSKIGDPQIATEIVSGYILPRDSEMVRSLPTNSLCSGLNTLTIAILNYEWEKAKTERDSVESKLVAKEEERRTWKAKAFNLTSEVSQARADRYKEEVKIVEERAQWAVTSVVRLYKKSTASLDMVQRRSMPAFSFGAQALMDFIDERVPDLDYRGSNLLVGVAVPPSNEELDDDDFLFDYQIPHFGSLMHQGSKLSLNPLPATPDNDLSSPDPSALDSGGTPPLDPAVPYTAGVPR
ncbi:hypothetical protein NE237_006721 [Protea cynaroides]|uniref:Uncharacterized protein n=1 Tax=Protea cynaroides TaxID=273540 RepID=A0A9Q0KN17_9MAGN|nr:hypothetical protein NE237_006721 [Protea cynaroides]